MGSWWGMGAARKALMGAAVAVISVDLTAAGLLVARRVNSRSAPAVTASAETGAASGATAAPAPAPPG